MIGSPKFTSEIVNTKTLFTNGRLTCKHLLCVLSRNRDRKLVNLFEKYRSLYGIYRLYQLQDLAVHASKAIVIQALNLIV